MKSRHPRRERILLYQSQSSVTGFTKKCLLIDKLSHIKYHEIFFKKEKEVSFFDKRVKWYILRILKQFYLSQKPKQIEPQSEPKSYTIDAGIKLEGCKAKPLTLVQYWGNKFVKFYLCSNICITAFLFFF